MVDPGIGLLLARLPDGNAGLLLSLGDPDRERIPQLYIAVRHPGTPPSHDEAVNRCEGLKNYHYVLAI